MQRLDVGTSGVMVICKSEHAYSVLKNAFRHRTVDKIYHALVQGHPDPLEGTIDAPIGRHPSADYKFAVMADGKHSVTHYEVLEAHRFASLLEVHLETGRTHQIRVHMAALKHPCVGDLTYGADPTLAKRVGLQRQWLHAVRLGFEHPDTGEYVEYESAYPADLAAALEIIRDGADADTDLVLRPGLHEDLPAVADLFVAARLGAVPAMPPIVGPVEGARQFVLGWDLARHELWVAERAERHRRVRDRRGQLARRPVRRSRRGARRASARRCSTWSRRIRPDGFCALGVRDATPRRGTSTASTAWSTSSAPTARPTRSAPPTSGWPGPGADPLAFYRGLIDDVDDQLGDLLARRVALTRAVQDHKRATAGAADRDLDREREIAHALAEHAPALGADRLERIVHVIITESLDASDS